ncbi:MAG: AI-2E family transporter [Patescibacteria group bacterium]|nr:AI-2E family transporter [Patescibacteria group bacterium]MDD4611101.1 AI-2E family transporter [Patescibacteria group bacterium]
MSEEKKDYNINISSATIFKTIIIVLALYFLFLVRDIVAILFAALVLSSAIDPWVDWMQKKKIPRTLGIVFIYGAVLIFVGGIVYLAVPPIIRQLTDLAQNFPHYFEKVISAFSMFKNYAISHNLLDNLKAGINSLSSSLELTAGGVYSTVSGIFGNIFSFILVLVITFYMAAEENALKKIIWSIAPEHHQPYILKLVNRMQIKIGLWLRGQLILSLIIFVLAFSGLSILGVRYALVLALIAGIIEFIPYLGPFLAAIPAIFLALAQSPMLALFVLILFYVIHLVESNIIIPKLMQKFVGLNPIVIIIALLIGFKLAGVVGAVLSIPFTTVISVFLKDIFEKKGEGQNV